MLKSSTKYAFVVSADEIICLKCELSEKVDYNTHKSGKVIDLFVEPWLHYSAPIKFADLLHERKGTVPVRLALLYLLHCSMQEDYELDGDIGNAANYKATTESGQRYVPKLNFKIGQRLGKY